MSESAEIVLPHHLPAPPQLEHSAAADRLRAMLDSLDARHRQLAQDAVCVGIYLLQMKAALPHGQFGQWAQVAAGKRERQCRYYMALASKFLAVSRVTVPELQASSQMLLGLEVDTVSAEAAQVKFDKFIKGRNLEGLLRDYDIVRRGGNQRPFHQEKPAPAALTPEAIASREENALKEALGSLAAQLEGLRSLLTNQVIWDVFQRNNRMDLLEAAIIQTREIHDNAAERLKRERANEAAASQLAPAPRRTARR